MKKNHRRRYLVEVTVDVLAVPLLRNGQANDTRVFVRKLHGTLPNKRARTDNAIDIIQHNEMGGEQGTGSAAKENTHIRRSKSTACGAERKNIKDVSARGWYK